MVGGKLKQIYNFGDQPCILIVHGAKYKMMYSLDFRVKKCNFHTQRKKKGKKRRKRKEEERDLCSGGEHRF